jgi:DNA-binding NarL/FixJ family response regulator
MVEAIAEIPYRQTAFAVFVLFVFGTSGAEIASEFADGETLASMGDDLFRLALSAIMLAVLLYEHLAQRRALRDLRGQLNKARGHLAQLDTKLQQIASQYRAVMQKQFDAWQLTASEQDVVIGLLKGLSFREIAQLRATREKTVRQQASSVYRKAGVTSRNELAAWFFEDMLEPPPVGDHRNEEANNPKGS